MESVELMKVMSDPRRLQILEFASQRPITVKELADAMGEKPSRLYYHVNKLEEVGLLKVVETKQTGNLVEKYYQAEEKTFFKGDIIQQAENLPVTLATWYRSLRPGLMLYEKALEKLKEEIDNGRKDIDRYPYQISINRATARMTADEWRESNIKLIEALRRAEGDDTPFPEEMKIKLTPEEAKEEGTYHYLLLSYRIEDALKLGLVDDDEE
jgi:DNA-binding transcriptional ArsR family regulator